MNILTDKFESDCFMNEFSLNVSQLTPKNTRISQYISIFDISVSN